MNPSITQSAPTATASAPSWVVFNGHVYRSDHKPAPFTSKEGVHYPRYHDGLVALVYEPQQLGLIGAAPELLAALRDVLEMTSATLCQIDTSHPAFTTIKGAHVAARAAIAKAEGAQ
jgi:hypothetical protein